MNNKYRPGIIGLGFLGGAMDHFFVSRGLTPFRYDKKGIGSEEEVNQADIIFVCVNTPFDKDSGQVDLKYVSSAISAIKGEKIVVVRSTVPPGTTDLLQEKFPQHAFLFNPEFLRAKFAVEDFKNPPRQIVGYTAKSRKYAEDLLAMLPEAPAEYTKIIPAKAAELVKYMANTMLATKVALANKAFDFCDKLEIEYEDIKHLIGADPRIGHWGMDVMYEGFRGYSGTCFPKDVRGAIALGNRLGVDIAWLEAMDEDNLRLLKKQDLDPDYGFPKEIKK